ncbi:MAG TPA: addiction module protein [Thermoanaerobaculia bacterium]|nr:addiction module protein [Thermoanaerobaculia bacterium]
MSISAKALLELALQLPREERARFAAELISSLGDVPETGVEEAWDVELQRRIEQVDQGEIQLLEWNAVKAEVAQALKRR